MNHQYRFSVINTVPTRCRIAPDATKPRSDFPDRGIELLLLLVPKRGLGKRNQVFALMMVKLGVRKGKSLRTAKILPSTMGILFRKRHRLRKLRTVLGNRKTLGRHLSGRI
jgi:hypothetical protein